MESFPFLIMLQQTDYILIFIPPSDPSFLLQMFLKQFIQITALNVFSIILITFNHKRPELSLETRLTSSIIKFSS